MSFNNFQQMSFYNLDAEIHYRYKKGTGDEYIILLHGAGCDHLMFEKQLSVFGNKYTLIAWDARGHGLSKLNRTFSFKDMYADCLKLFEIHNIKKAILIGHSMGGNVAQEITYYFPELVSKCILIDCTINTQKLTAIEKMSLNISKIIFNIYPRKMLIRQSANACGKTEYTKKYVKDCLKKMRKERFIEILMSIYTCLHEDTTFTFKQPVLLMYGEEDTMGNIKKSMAFLSKNDGTVCVIENAGHNSNQDNPDDINKQIKIFIEKCE